MDSQVIIADYNNSQHADEIVTLMDSYSRDPMGGGKPLSHSTKANLVKELAKLSHAFSLIYYCESKAVGLINCFYGFSTFKCRPLINIHDAIVSKDYRGLGICQTMLKKVESIARENNCCKITLEVLEGNHTAQKAYRKSGFSGYELDPKMGNALFWEKELS